VFDFVKNNSPVAAIRIRRREETPVAGFAASELQEYRASMSEATLPVAEPEGTDALPSSIASAAVLRPDGDGGHPDITSVGERLRGARPDAFAITPVSDSLVRAGVTDRGTLYAVHALLEELGVRFHAPDFPFYDGHHERVPNRESVSVAVDRFAEPSLGYRTKDVHGPGATPGTLPAVIDWLAKTRHNVGTSRLT
jgi:hypothetical protein